MSLLAPLDGGSLAGAWPTAAKLEPKCGVLMDLQGRASTPVTHPETSHPTHPAKEGNEIHMMSQYFTIFHMSH